MLIEDITFKVGEDINSAYNRVLAAKKPTCGRFNNVYMYGGFDKKPHLAFDNEVRVNAAIAALQGILAGAVSNTMIMSGLKQEAEREKKSVESIVAQHSVMYANALLKELQNKCR